MSPATHQTIKLSKGKHSSPTSGACVMELASMLAGEQFTDHPRSVCPVIGSFLRAYNDSIDDQRRQDLYAYASKAVGSRTSAVGEQTRAEFLNSWAAQLQSRRWHHRLLPPQMRAAVLQHRPPAEASGTHAVHSIRRHTNETHAAVLQMLDALLAIGAPGWSPVLPRTARPQAVAPQDTTLQV